MKLSDNIKSIALEVEALGKAARTAAKATSDVKMALKFGDSASEVKNVTDKFAALQKELDAVNKLREKLGEAGKKIQEEIANEKGNTKESKQKIADLEKLAANYANQLERADKYAKQLNNSLSEANKRQEKLNEITQDVNDKFRKWQEAAETLSNITKKIYSTLKNIVAESTKAGQELYSLSKRYNVSAEEIQLWNRSLQLATGQSDLFNSSIDVMIKGMSQIAAGRGVAYRNALRAIGVSYKEIAELTASEQFETIVEGLASIENESMRSTYAQQLFGEAGQYVSAVLSEGSDALEEYRKKAKDFGIITDSGAKALAEMNIKLEQAKSKLSIAKAEIAVALTPAIEALTKIITESVAPIIKIIAKGLEGLGTGGQIIIGILGLFIALAPRVISHIMQITIWVKALKADVNTLNVAINGLKSSLGIIGFISIGISAIVSLSGAIAVSTERAKEATEAYEGLANAANDVVNAGNNAQVNAEQTITSSSTKTVEMNVEITGKGDTAISDDAAVKVAQLTADEVNKAWGEFVKG